MPKAKNPAEYKWHKLNQEYKTQILEKLGLFFEISCCGILIIYTNILKHPITVPVNAFISLVEGCFSGYEEMPSQSNDLREKIRQNFFSMCNNTHIHCDPDFRSLKPDKLVRSLVMTLSKKDRRIREFTPIHIPLKTHESAPIQIADIIAGSIGNRIKHHEKPLSPLLDLFFDNRKINKKSRNAGKFAKAYYWFRSS